jgi:hypothetical protein
VLLVTLLNEGKTDTLSLGEGNKGLFAVTDDENVGETGGKSVATGVLDVGDLVGTGVVFDVLEDTNTTDVVTTDDEDGGAVVKLDNTVDLTSLKIELKLKC